MKSFSTTVQWTAPATDSGRHELHETDARIIGHEPGFLKNVYPPQMPFCQADVGMDNMCVRAGFLGVP